MAKKKTIKKENSFSVGYFPGLDVLRFICATGVIFHHTAQQLFSRGIALTDSGAHKFTGSFFLDVFFIISGFLIASILIKENESDTYSLKNFYLRRIIRIWPLYFLAVAILIILVPALKHSPSEIIKTNALYALGFSVNFQLLFDGAAKTYSVLWSVCIEEHIYLVLPFLLFIFKRNFKRLSFFLLVVGLASWLCFGFLHASQQWPSAYFNSLCYFYYFGAGMLLAVFHKQITSPKIKFLFTVPAQLLIYTLLILCVFNFLPAAFYIFPVWVLLSGFFGTYLVAAASRQNFILQLGPALSRFTGNISYAMYMVHIVLITVSINYLLRNNIRPEGIELSLWFPCVTTLLSIFVASILYYLYERPILKLKKRFTSVTNK